MNSKLPPNFSKISLGPVLGFAEGHFVTFLFSDLVVQQPHLGEAPQVVRTEGPLPPPLLLLPPPGNDLDIQCAMLLLPLYIRRLPGIVVWPRTKTLQETKRCCGPTSDSGPRSRRGQSQVTVNHPIRFVVGTPYNYLFSSSPSKSSSGMYFYTVVGRCYSSSSIAQRSRKNIRNL